MRMAVQRITTHVSAGVILLCSLTPASGVDDDADGISDVWQQVHGVPSGAGADDNDGDGFTNLAESLFGTNPHAFTPGFLNLTTQNGFHAATWQTILGVRYQLEVSNDLVTWESVGAPIVGTGGQVTAPSPEHPAGATLKFFCRLRASQPQDLDGDGLNAFEEGLLGTSDSAADSDGDRVPDATEFRLHLDPTSAASNDGDSVPDDWEVFKFGNTNLPGGYDGDADGFTLMDEFTFDLNPLINDFATGSKTHTFTFDAAGQLRAVAGTLSESIDYDEEGNIVSSQ